VLAPRGRVDAGGPRACGCDKVLAVPGR